MGEKWTREQLETMTNDQLRKILRERKLLVGYPAAFANKDKDPVVDLILGAVTAEAVLLSQLRRKASPDVEEWVKTNLPALWSRYSDGKPEPSPAPKKSAQEEPKAEEPKAKAEAEAKAPEVPDPRRHPHWSVLVTASGAMGIDLGKALGYFVDEQRRQVDDLSAQIAKLTEQLEQSKRKGLPEHKDEDGWGVNPLFKPGALFDDISWFLDNDEPVLLVGPAGSSKTQYLRYYCKTRQRKMKVVSCHGHMMADVLEGQSTLKVDPETRQTVMEWIGGILQVALQEGIFLIFDEIDRLPPAGQHLLNDVLLSRSLTLKEGPLAGTTIKAAPGFFVVATGNTMNGTTGEYTANAIDKATLSRFTPIIVGYDEAAERALLKAIGIDDQLAERIMKAFKEARQAAADQKIYTAPGTRNLERLAKNVKRGMPPRKAWTYMVSNQQTQNTADLRYKNCERIGEMLA